MGTFGRELQKCSSEKGSGDNFYDLPALFIIINEKDRFSTFYVLYLLKVNLKGLIRETYVSWLNFTS